MIQMVSAHLDGGNMGNETDISGSADTYDYYNVEQRQEMLFEAHVMIALVFGFISLLLNSVILAALYQVRDRITTHYQLIISLAVSDMLVASSVLFNYINFVYNPLYVAASGSERDRLQSVCTRLVIKALNTAGLIVTLLNLMLMALDHYLAIIKPLHYPVLVSKRRTSAVIVTCWILAFILGFSDFFSALHKEHPVRNYCEKVQKSRFQSEFTIFAIAPFCLSAMIYVYSKICFKVWKRNIGSNRFGPIIRRNEPRRSTKAVVTTLLNIGSFILCWLPVCLFEVSLLIMAKINKQDIIENQSLYLSITRHLYNLLILNAIADPIIYTIRLREVRVGFLRMFPCSAKFSVHQNRDSTAGSLTRNTVIDHN